MKEQHRNSAIILLAGVVIGGIVAYFAIDWSHLQPEVAPPAVRPPSALVRTSTTDPIPTVAKPPQTTGIADVPSPTNTIADPGCGDPAPFKGIGEVAGVAVRLPERYDPHHHHVVLMLFHDDLQKPEQFIKVSGFDETADRLGIVVIAPHDPSLTAWTDNNSAAAAGQVLRAVASQICLDTARVFAVGYGAGGRVVEAMPCLMPMSGIATVAYRSTTKDVVCAPQEPVPYIHLAPTQDKYSPVAGGAGCGGGHLAISLADKEKMWRTRNHCQGPRRTFHESTEATCYAWSCGDTPFGSCHVDAGRRWPGTKRRVVDFRNCDGPLSTFAYADTIWRFFSHGPG